MKVFDTSCELEFRWWPEEDRPVSARNFQTHEEALAWLTHKGPADLVRGIRNLLTGQVLTQLSRMSDHDLLEEPARLLHSRRLVVADGGSGTAAGEPAVDGHAQFEDWSIAHLKKYFPVQASAMGANQLRAFVQHEVKNAASYGIKARRDVSKFLDLMVVFGRNFDMDARHSRAGEILRKRGDSKTAMQALLDKAKTALRSK